MFRPVRPQLTLSTLRTTTLIAALAAALSACDSGAQTQPGVQQDGTSTPDLGPDSASEDTSTPAPDAAEDTAVAPDTTPADTNVAPDTTVTEDTNVAPDTTPADTTEPDTTVTADTNVQPDGSLVLPTDRPPVVANAASFIDGWTMQPGKEVTKCVVKRLDNEDVLWVSQIHTQLSEGSHHMIIYKSMETQEKPDAFNCDPFVQVIKGNTLPLMITQIREETLQFPNGIAFKFEPHQMVRLESHYLNYFPDHDIVARGDVTFEGIAADKVVAEANLLFYGDPDLNIPEGPFDSPWRWISVLPDTHVFAITGHTHAFGTNVEITSSTGVNDPGTAIYPGETPFVWSEPPVVQFDPALEFTGDQGFRYHCSWDNTSGGELNFGESARKEMCFLWAYYYPSQGYRLCVSPGSIGNGVAGDEICCPGHWVCDYIQQFL